MKPFYYLDGNDIMCEMGPETHQLGHIGADGVLVMGDLKPLWALSEIEVRNETDQPEDRLMMAMKELHEFLDERGLIRKDA